MAAALTQRVEVGAYYTNGHALYEVEKVCALGSVELRNSATGVRTGCGIDTFRRNYWLVREPRS